MSLTLTIKGLGKADLEIKNFTKEIEKQVNNEFFDFGQSVVNDAKKAAPVDEGRLRQSISFSKENLKVSVSANVDYAAYIEFGTKKFAAKYVSTLPADWQTYASTFKGKGGGGFTKFFYTILQWVQRKGLATTFSVKTRKRSNSRANIQNEYNVAYAIAINILREGIRPQPFLIPAYEKNKIILINNLKKNLGAKGITPTPVRITKPIFSSRTKNRDRNRR